MTSHEQEQGKSTDLNQYRSEVKKRANKTEIGDKIRAIRKQRGLSQPKLAALLGVTKNAVTNWEAGTSRPGFMIIAKLCEVLSISADTFFGLPERGNTLSPGEQAHMAIYRQLDVYAQRSVDGLIESILDNRRQAFYDRCEETCRYMLHSEEKVCAGSGNYLNDTYEAGHMYLHGCDAVDRADEVITISGRSMEPTYYDGDDVLVEYTESILPGEIGIFVVAGEGMIKEYQPDGLYPHNRQFSVIRPSADEEAHCVGRVLGAVTPEMRITRHEAEVLQELHPDR